MRLTAKAFVLFVLLCLAGQEALAVGYEQNPLSSPQSAQTQQQNRSESSILAAIKEATFADRCVDYLDQTALFVKDLLSQFGLKADDKK